MAGIASRPIGVLRFPGTNCDRDVFEGIKALGAEPVWLWHADHFNFKEFRALVLPGGFSYGDYLRSGALAARANCIASVREAAAFGTPILGICNGFQVLTEAGLLPGALSRNQGLRFIDAWTELEWVGHRALSGQSGGQPKSALRIPIAHADGRYVASEDELDRMADNGQIWLKYRVNPNGSLRDIAGVCNEKGNVMGLMPHPERALANWMGSQDGKYLLDFVTQMA